MRKYIGSFEKQIILRYALGKPLMILIDLLLFTGGSLPTQKHGCDDVAEPNMIFFKDPHLFPLTDLSRDDLISISIFKQDTH